jgi:hypothetical protein
MLLETTEQGQSWYQVHFVARRRRAVPAALGKALDDTEQVAAREREAAQRTKKWVRLRQFFDLVQGEAARSWLSLGPLLLLFLLIEWLLVKNLDSFPQLLSIRGVVTVAVVGSAFPALLLLASRRKGDLVPGFVLSFLANPLIAGGIYLVAIASLFMHGLLIWQNPFQRGVALLVGVVLLITTSLIVRQGAFARRLVIEIRQDAAGEGIGTFTVTGSGRAAIQTRVRLGYADGERVHEEATGAIPDFPNLNVVTVHLSGTKARELKVWVHRVTAEGYSENLPALVNMSSGKGIREFHLERADQQYVFSLREIVKKEQKDSPDRERQLAIEVQLASETP